MYCRGFLEVSELMGFSGLRCPSFFRNFNEFLSFSDLSQGSLEVVWVYGIDYLLHITSERVLISCECLLGFLYGDPYLSFFLFFPKLTI